MKYGLYREAPFRPLFVNGHGFAEPKKDEYRQLWAFSSEDAAKTLHRTLRHDSGPGGFVFIEKLSKIQQRIKDEGK